MIFHQTALIGAYIIDVEKIPDERGFFARSWSKQEFAEHGLDPDLAQCNVSFNLKKGTLRGMHYQIPPFAESKLVRCTRGRIYDVIVDIRPRSPSFLKWLGVELSEENHKTLFVPKGFAHGFQTLTDNSEVFYQMSTVYSPDHARGFRWDSNNIDIAWLTEITSMSDRDRQLLPCNPDEMFVFHSSTT